MEITEEQVRRRLAGLPRQDVMIGCDYIVHDISAPEIAELRGVSVRTVRRAVARVLVVFQSVGVSAPKPARTGARHLIRGFTPALALAL